jgi:ClpP class serine protease
MVTFHRGSLFKPEKALQLGLVDELAKDKVDAIEKCKNYILSYENIPGKNTIPLYLVGIDTH